MPGTDKGCAVGWCSLKRGDEWQWKSEQAMMAREYGSGEGSVVGDVRQTNYGVRKGQAKYGVRKGQAARWVVLSLRV